MPSLKEFFLLTSLLFVLYCNSSLTTPCLSRKEQNMKFVTDVSLTEAISQLLLTLLRDAEAAKNICFVIVDGVPYLTRIWVNEQTHLILVSIKVKELLKSICGEAIFCAQISHEIGHLIHMRKMESADFESLKFKTESEKEADKYALGLLSCIFPNPKELLLKQINRALTVTIGCGHASAEEIALAQHFAKERQANLLQLVA